MGGVDDNAIDIEDHGIERPAVVSLGLGRLS
jgi:hypothetical protein